MHIKELKETICCLRDPIRATDFNYDFQLANDYHWFMFFSSETLPHPELKAKVKLMLGDLLDNRAVDVGIQRVQGTLRVELQIHNRSLIYLSKQYIINNVVRTLIGATVPENYYYAR